MRVLTLLMILATGSAFAPSAHKLTSSVRTRAPVSAISMSADSEGMTRREASAAVATTLAGLLAVPGPAAARGRATQVKTWARYGSRVEATRSWMAGTFQGYIKTGDFASMKADTDPKKGAFTSFMTACDLWAASYSDANPSPKTVAMVDDVNKLREFQAEVYSVARRGLGEEVKTTGGLFGVGGKAEPPPTKEEAKTELLAAYEKAKVAYNDYCVINNEGRPFEIDELSEL